MSLGPRLPLLLLASLLTPGNGAVTWHGPGHSEYGDLLHHLAQYGEGEPSTQAEQLEAGQLELEQLELEQLEAGQLEAGQLELEQLEAEVAPVSLLGAVAGLVSPHTDRQASLPAVNR